MEKIKFKDALFFSWMEHLNADFFRTIPIFPIYLLFTLNFIIFPRGQGQQPKITQNGHSLFFLWKLHFLSTHPVPYLLYLAAKAEPSSCRQQSGRGLPGGHEWSRGDHWGSGPDVSGKITLCLLFAYHCLQWTQGIHASSIEKALCIRPCAVMYINGLSKSWNVLLLVNNTKTVRGVALWLMETMKSVKTFHCVLKCLMSKCLPWHW